MKGVLSLWCLSSLLLFGLFAGQLEARASCWCVIVCCLLLVVLLDAIVRWISAASINELHQSRTELCT